MSFYDDPWEHIPEQLQVIADNIDDGGLPTATVRELLAWFGAQRRGRDTVTVIRSALDFLNLTTVPDFNATHLGGEIAFLRADNAGQGVSLFHDATSDAPPPEPASVEAQEPASPLPASNAESVPSILTQAAETKYADPTYRIRRLEMANRPPVCVTPDATVEQAITVMLHNDFSQLPVMTSERDVKGLLSWKSLGSRLSLGRMCTNVRDAMESACPIIGLDETLWRVVMLLKEHDCVLVHDSTKKICGIITPYDISMTFGQLGEPFFSLGEIENHIRVLLDGRFSNDELRAVRDPNDSSRQINGVADLSLGEYARLLENPTNWQRLELKVDRATFVKELQQIRGIRNEVMHFDPEGIDEDQVQKLRTFVDFLRRLRKLRAGIN